jgi:hypothetical protein
MTLDRERPHAIVAHVLQRHRLDRIVGTRAGHRRYFYSHASDFEIHVGGRDGLDRRSRGLLGSRARAQLDRLGNQIPGDGIAKQPSAPVAEVSSHKRPTR